MFLVNRLQLEVTYRPTISHRISKNSAIILEYYLMNNEDNNSLKFQEF